MDVCFTELSTGRRTVTISANNDSFLMLGCFHLLLAVNQAEQGQVALYSFDMNGNNHC